MTLSNFLLTISAGFPIQVLAATHSVNSVLLGEIPYDFNTVTAIDLGKYWTANQILDSYPLRTAIAADLFIITAGVITPTVDQVA